MAVCISAKSSAGIDGSIWRSALNARIRSDEARATSYDESRNHAW